jgi:phospholipid/cholesterol/gamma-HCH transport system ATP-binding protein
MADDREHHAPNDGKGDAHIEVRDLTMAWGNRVIMQDMNFTVRRGDIFVIMGGSGSGKSTLLYHLIGLVEPAKGDVLYDGVSFTHASQDERARLLGRMGVTYQGGALFSALTLGQNVGLPLEEFTGLSPREIRDVAQLKLSLVGLRGFEDHYPSEISGGMQKRAALARAIALDPEVLFFDEPSAGLDPISSRRLDELILALRDGLGATVVVVTHELASIFSIADDAIFLDVETKTLLAHGNPKDLLEHCPEKTVQEFLRRGDGSGKAATHG